MRAYEVMVILDPSLEETVGVAPTSTSTSSARTAAASRTSTSGAGAAWPTEIQKNAEGIYAVIS